MKFFYLLSAFLTLGITNTSQSAGFQSDVELYIQEEVEPLARRQLVAYQFGKPLHLDTNRGVTYTATRFQRLPLPYAPLRAQANRFESPSSTCKCRKWMVTCFVSESAGIPAWPGPS